MRGDRDRQERIQEALRVVSVGNGAYHCGESGHAAHSDFSKAAEGMCFQTTRLPTRRSCHGTIIYE